MRKTWVKRDNIYYKPFYKQKLKMTLLGVLLMAVVFFGYQFFYISQLQTESGTGGFVRVETSQHQANNERVNSIGNDAGSEADGLRDEGGGIPVSVNQSVNLRGPSQDSRYVYVEKIGNYEKRILR